MDLELPNDFKEFLKLLRAHGVKYLLIGGYAVGIHGYVRATNDIDFWIAMSPDNANRVVGLLKDFGFDVPELSRDLFLERDQIVNVKSEVFEKSYDAICVIGTHCNPKINIIGNPHVAMDSDCVAANQEVLNAVRA